MRKEFRINSCEGIKKVVLASDDDIIKTAFNLTNIIFNQYEDKIINHIINTEYPFFETSERMFIKGECKKNIKKHRSELQSIIFYSLLEYVKTEDNIIIDGYVAFRLKKYISVINKYIDNVINDYLIKKESDELIESLIVYTELQIPMTELIVVLYDVNEYIVADESGEIIFTLKNYDDVLLDAILTLSPNKIAIVNPNSFANKELLETIAKIYRNKVIFVECSKKNTSKVDKE